MFKLSKLKQMDHLIWHIDDKHFHTAWLTRADQKILYLSQRAIESIDRSLRKHNNNQQYYNIFISVPPNRPSCSHEKRKTRHQFLQTLMKNSDYTQHRRGWRLHVLLLDIVRDLRFGSVVSLLCSWWEVSVRHRCALLYLIPSYLTWPSCEV